LTNFVIYVILRAGGSRKPYNKSAFLILRGRAQNAWARFFYSFGSSKKSSR